MRILIFVVLPTFLFTFTANAQLAPVPGTNLIGSSLDPLLLDPLSQAGANLLPVI
jgi:hypothetical protein